MSNDSNSENDQQNDHDENASFYDVHVAQSPKASVAEWILRIISIGIVGGLIAYFTYMSLQPIGAPDFEVVIHHDQIERRSAGWMVPFDVTNKSTVSLKTLTIEGTLTTGGGPETTPVTIAVIGAEETATSTLVFQRNPELGELVLSVKSFIKP